MARSAKSDRPRVLRKDRTGANPVTVGILALVVILIACWFAFRKDNPLSSPFKLQAVFQTSNGVRQNMPVRIAGVDVGKVKSVEAQEGTQATVIVMEVDPRGLPIHKDAELKIRPRIFLEGNYFIELKPGTPSQPTLETGDTVPVTQTATPVQLDQVLTSLQQSTREDLQGLLQGFGDGLTREPTEAEDATQAASVRGKTAAQALNKSLDDAPGASRGTAVVNSAIVGNGNDVSATIKALDGISRSLSGETAALQDVVVNFNRTAAAFADESSALSEAISELPGTLKTANSTLTALNEAFPPTRAFAKEILPGVEETQATIDAARPWLAQTTALLSPDELQGLTSILAPTTEDLAEAGNGTLGLLQQQNLLAQCATKVLLPTGDVVIEDGPRTSGVENYKEFFYALVGFNGESQNSDGNGQWLRATVGGNSKVETGVTPLGVKLYGNALLPPQGTRPAMPTKLPTQNFDANCKDQARPDLNSAVTGSPDGQNTKPGKFLGFGDTASASASSTSSAPRESRAQAAKTKSPDKAQVAASRSEQPTTSVAGGLLGVLNPLRDTEGTP
ncbi:MlaD family protein [Svornostia abyssi]|uniref:MlaD family protein n=1 Tax=Svornostia abyssi TaxID=2898438 RepID=A0ABY5PFJ6_9ACTN|nr:MlaD family protein [Parviterribacteraceae bacterium J379]